MKSASTTQCILRVWGQIESGKIIHENKGWTWFVNRIKKLKSKQSSRAKVAHASGGGRYGTALFFLWDLRSAQSARAGSVGERTHNARIRGNRGSGRYIAVVLNGSYYIASRIFYVHTHTYIHTNLWSKKCI